MKIPIKREQCKAGLCYAEREGFRRQARVKNCRASESRAESHSSYAERSRLMGEANLLPPSGLLSKKKGGPCRPPPERGLTSSGCRST